MMRRGHLLMLGGDLEARAEIPEIVTGPRVGIMRATELSWRYMGFALEVESLSPRHPRKRELSSAIGERSPPLAEVALGAPALSELRHGTRAWVGGTDAPDP